MTPPYQAFHGSCIHHEIITPGPGDLIISLQEQALLRSPRGELALHGPGSILYVETAVESLYDEVFFHLETWSLSSEFRFGVAAGLGLYTEQVRDRKGRVDHQAIDRWIDRFTVFSIRPHVLGRVPLEPRIGLFNGAWRDWGHKHRPGWVG